MDEVINNRAEQTARTTTTTTTAKQVNTKELALASQKCEQLDEVDFKNNNNNNNHEHEEKKKLVKRGSWFHNFHKNHHNAARSGINLFTKKFIGKAKHEEEQEGETAAPLTSQLKCKSDETNKNKTSISGKARKFNTYGGGKRRSDSAFLERFKSYAKDDSDVTKKNEKNNNTQVQSSAKQHYVSTKLTLDSRDLFGGSRSELVSVQKTLASDEHGDKAMRYLARNLSKLWWRRANSVDISTPDPEFKVSYLGNVLTGWAKGEGCVEKQLNTLWRNYIQNTKPDVIMHIKVCASGLKATTRQHGLTEYWSNRITHCCWPKNYPGVFCWVYRHEGRKLKNELRCHAVLCNKEKIAEHICNTLKENLESALRDFKREKILKQNARLSLANAAYDNPSLPRRKILLSVGGNNYRPPLERSKSAPKLMAIEEAVGEEEGEEVEATNEPEMKPCCQRDSLYPAMTLGRRHCRRGHSIRRTGKLKNAQFLTDIKCNSNTKVTETSDGSNESFEKFLCNNNYDPSDTFEKDLISYFDMQLNKNNSKSFSELCDIKDEPEDDEEEEQHLSMIPNINTAPVVNLSTYPSRNEYFQQNEQSNILQLLQRDSMRKKAQLELVEIYNNNNTTSTQEDSLPSIDSKMLQQLAVDSDAASLSSGYETVSMQNEAKKPTICTLDNLKITDNGNHSDSEYSDESGYVEEKDIRTSSHLSPEAQR